MKRRLIDIYKSNLMLLNVEGLTIKYLYKKLNNVRLSLLLVKKSLRTLYRLRLPPLVYIYKILYLN